MKPSQLARVRASLGLCRRVVIVGGPGRGKSTLAADLAAQLGVPYRPTDAIDGDWSGVSAQAAAWLREDGPQVIEGVAAVRALRRLVADGERPSFVVVRLGRRHPDAGPESPGQTALAKGVDTVWAEVAPELKRRGVLVLDL